MSTTKSEPFAGLDWALLAGTALIWGSSFLFMRIAVDNLRPGLVAFLRLALGVATLALFPATRRPVPWSAWPRIALVGISWMAAPFFLFSVALQWIDSSVAGMLNGAVPLFAAVIAAGVARRMPGWRQQLGLTIGLLGVVVVSMPSTAGASASALPEASFSVRSALAIIALGALGTGVAFGMFVTLVGRVGSTRASVTAYFLPPVAIMMGALVLREPLGPSAFVGTLLIIAGAYLVSRAESAKAAATTLAKAATVIALLAGAGRASAQTSATPHLSPVTLPPPDRATVWPLPRLSGRIVVDGASHEAPKLRVCDFLTIPARQHRANS